MSSLCPNPDRCGSCGWSHIPYEKQLQQKLSDINGSFALKHLDVQIEEIVPSEKTTHYRNRMDFVIDWQGSVGLREKGKWWRVIDNHTCFLADERIDEQFVKVRTWVQSCGLTFWDRKANVGCLRYAVIRATRTGETMVHIITSSPQDGEEEKNIQAALHALVPTLACTTVLWSVNATATDVSFGDLRAVISGEGTITEEINGVRYRISPQAFFQTNSFTAPALLGTVAEFAGDLAEKTLLDLYCGTGFFALGLKGAAKTVGVELVTEAIVDAKANAQANGREDIEFYDLSAETYSWRDIRPDIIVADPPRVGLHDATIAELLASPPQHLVLVSCNYKSLAREIALLAPRFTVERLRAVDMFPHTPHVETVALLSSRVQ